MIRLILAFLATGLVFPGLLAAQADSLRAKENSARIRGLGIGIQAVGGQTIKRTDQRKLYLVDMGLPLSLQRRAPEQSGSLHKPQLPIMQPKPLNIQRILEQSPKVREKTK